MIFFPFLLSYKGLLVFFPLSNKVIEPGIGTGCIERRIREGNDVIVLADRKAFQLPQLRQLLAKLGAEEVSSRFVILEIPSETANRS